MHCCAYCIVMYVLCVLGYAPECHDITCICHAAFDMCVAARTMCPMNAMNPCVLSLCSVREGYVNQMYMSMHALQGLCVCVKVV